MQEAQKKLVEENEKREVWKRQRQGDGNLGRQGKGEKQLLWQVMDREKEEELIEAIEQVGKICEEGQTNSMRRWTKS